MWFDIIGTRYKIIFNKFAYINGTEKSELVRIIAHVAPEIKMSNILKTICLLEFICKIVINNIEINPRIKQNFMSCNVFESNRITR